MDLKHFVTLHGLTRAAKLTGKKIPTIQSWMKSGKSYRLKDVGENHFQVWELK